MTQRPTVHKVVCYVTYESRLLVIKHVDYPLEITGIQVPAGTVRENEDVEVAAIRELFEETSIHGLARPVFLGTQEYDMWPSKNEIQYRHYFHFVYQGEKRERWLSQEEHDGEYEPTRFECFWIPLADGHVLSAGRGALLWKLAEE